MRITSASAIAVLWLWRGCQALRGLQLFTGFEAGSPQSLSNETIAKIREHAGLYVNKTAHPEHSNTILITASNIAYADMLRNWRCHADKLGLDYLVVAFDPEILEEAGSNQTLLVEGSHYFPEHSKFRQGHFNEMSCMKLRIVQWIMNATGLSVVFSDPDNVFREDPFAANVSLGSKMLSNQYDYIYQQNHGRLNLPNVSDIGAEVNEGNTGFYFVSGSRKAKGVQALFEAALTECKRHTNLDDQTNFWQALKTIRRQYGREDYGDDNFACANLCGQGKLCSAPDEEVLSYCEMDPWNHATGWTVWQYHGPNKIVTYHSNYVGGGMDCKIGKLVAAGFWDDGCAGPGKEVISRHKGGD